MIVPILLTALAGTSAQVETEISVIGIYGYVKDESWFDETTHPPVPGAFVELTELRTGRTRRTKADSAGFYAFDCLDLGLYDLRFSMSGFLPSSVEMIRFDSPTSIRIDEILHLDQPPVSDEFGQVLLRILDSAGEPIEGVTVSEDGGSEFSERSDRCGNVWRRFEPGRHILLLQKHGFGSTRISVSAKRAPTELKAVLDPVRK
ncbi:MAG: carboxypeptidase-like regulatory domain-containing protein [Acidobacteriota bacterium]